MWDSKQRCEVTIKILQVASVPRRVTVSGFYGGAIFLAISPPIADLVPKSVNNPSLPKAFPDLDPLRLLGAVESFLDTFSAFRLC
jgi:hypothetical protein